MTPPNPTTGWDAEREAKRLNSKLVPAVMRKEADAICEKYLRAAYDAGRSCAPSAEATAILQQVRDISQLHPNFWGEWARLGDEAKAFLAALTSNTGDDE